MDLPQYVGKTFEVTVKPDGQSMTVYKHNGQIGVCSRNLELKEGDNPLWNIARKLALFDKIPDGVALQGEYLSPKVQGNYEKVAEPHGFATMFTVSGSKSTRVLRTLDAIVHLPTSLMCQFLTRVSSCLKTRA